MFYQRLPQKICDTYIDNILIYYPSKRSHVSYVSQVLKKLRENHLYVKDKKCEFHVSTMTFLGYTISTDGVVMDDKKLQAVRGWPASYIIK